MKSKFEEFYYEDDKNYPVDVYWNLYDKNHAEAIRKYEGHIFCPLCRLAPLTVAKGNERRYFKVVESDMDKHDALCLPENRAACIAFCFWHSLFHIPYGKGNVGTIFSP